MLRSLALVHINICIVSNLVVVDRDSQSRRLYALVCNCIKKRLTITAANMLPIDEDIWDSPLSSPLLEGILELRPIT
jgi:hypothetical protein